MREYAGEMAFAGNWTSEFASLEELGRTLDWKARNMTNGSTTVDAHLGYTDDRLDRRIERYAPLNSTPPVGDPYTDFLFMDSLAALIPWIVDRRSKESGWWLDHQNGRSEGDRKDAFKFDSLYIGGWTMARGSAAGLYYPPFWVYEHPLTSGDLWGESPNETDAAYVKPASPEINPERAAVFTEP
jgi:hypothetical protein